MKKVSGELKLTTTGERVAEYHRAAATITIQWTKVGDEYVAGCGDYGYNISRLPAGSGTAYKWVTTARRITGSPNEPVVVRRNLTLAEAKSAAAYHATSHQEEK